MPCCTACSLTVLAFFFLSISKLLMYLFVCLFVYCLKNKKVILY